MLLHRNKKATVPLKIKGYWPLASAQSGRVPTRACHTLVKDDLRFDIRAIGYHGDAAITGFFKARWTSRPLTLRSDPLQIPIIEAAENYAPRYTCAHCEDQARRRQAASRSPKRPWSQAEAGLAYCFATLPRRDDMCHSTLRSLVFRRMPQARKWWSSVLSRPRRITRADRISILQHFSRD
jgi:hypothetical protein